jgi:hypothetical protein
VSRVFYRIIEGPVPTLKDFLTHKELGKPLRVKAIEREWATAISVYDDLESAIEQAKKIPSFGSFYIAKIVIPDDEVMEIAKTFKNPHHFSIYAPAWKVLKLVEGDTIMIPQELGNG